MKVLITGVAGFLGTHVAEYFKNKGWDVMGIDNLTDYELKRTKFDVKKARKHNLEFLEEIGVEFKIKDVRILTIKECEDIDFIIHCAAQPAMTIAIENPKLDMSNNVEGTVNMLDIARKLKIPFVNCSSIHIYGNSGNKGLVEKETRFELQEGTPQTISEISGILEGDLTPLHASKRATELYTQAYAETYRMRTASFRLTGMYGPRQFGGMDHGWVANFAIRTIKGRELTIFGTAKQVRDILYAEDAARAFYLWYEKGSSGIYNIGGGMEASVSLRECIDIIASQSNKEPIIKMEKKRFGDLYYFVCDYRKAEEAFGWKPSIFPVDGISRLISWIKKNEEIL